MGVYDGKNLLVSLCLKSYNQKDFFREALDAALRQTYSPLEIIISDDASTDGSDEMIRQMIADYQRRDSRHRIVYNRNEHNLGVALNCQKAYSLAKGALIVNGDGDDISYPERTEKIVSEWFRDGKRAKVIVHLAKEMDVCGRELESVRSCSALYPLGAMMAYSRDVYTQFADIKCVDAYDDDVYAHRGMILGNELVINLPLIHYRVGNGISTGGNLHARRARVARMCLSSVQQSYLDLDSQKGSLSVENYEKLKGLFRKYEDHYQLELTLHSSRNPFKRYAAFRKMFANEKGADFFKGLVLCFLPDMIYGFMRFLARKVRS